LQEQLGVEFFVSRQEGLLYDIEVTTFAALKLLKYKALA
jgi:hypothetical protein